MELDFPTYPSRPLVCLTLVVVTSGVNGVEPSAGVMSRPLNRHTDRALMAVHLHRGVAGSRTHTRESPLTPDRQANAPEGIEPSTTLQQGIRGRLPTPQEGIADVGIEPTGVALWSFTCTVLGNHEETSHGYRDRSRKWRRGSCTPVRYHAISVDKNTNCHISRKASVHPHTSFMISQAVIPLKISFASLIMVASLI